MPLQSVVKTANCVVNSQVLFQIRFTITENSISTSGNSSSVSTKTEIKTNESGVIYTWERTVSASSKTGTSTHPTVGTWVQIENPSFTIKHNADGTKTIAYEVKVTKSLTSYSATISGNLTLTPIAAQKRDLSNVALNVVSSGNTSGRTIAKTKYLQGVDYINFTLTNMGATGGYYPYAYVTLVDSGGNTVWSSGKLSGASTITGQTPILQNGGMQYTLRAVVNATNAEAQVTKTQYMNCVSYSPPSITAFEAYRCKSNGTKDDVGAYINFSGSGSFSPISGYTNAITITYTDGNGTTLSAPPVALAVTQTIQVIMTVTDKVLQTVQQSVYIGKGFAFMQFAGDASGFGLGIGQIPDAHRLQSALVGQFPNLLSLFTETDSVMPGGADLNNEAYWEAGKCWYIKSAAVANTLTHYPNGRYAIHARCFTIEMNLPSDGATYNRIQVYLNGDLTIYMRRRTQNVGITNWIKVQTANA